jgi:hypothetical protein
MKFRSSFGAAHGVCVRVHVLVYALRCNIHPPPPPKLRGGQTLISKMGVADSNEGVAPAVA